MDKRCKKSDRQVVLKLKTGINLYRAFMFILFFISLLFFVSTIIDKSSDKNVILITFLSSFMLLLTTIFMDKIVYWLNLPTDYLIVTKSEVVYKKRKKETTYKLEESKLEFHSFFEDLESTSLLHIKSNSKEDFIPITKKQYKNIIRFLKNLNINS